MFVLRGGSVQRGRGRFRGLRSNGFLGRIVGAHHADHAEEHADRERTHDDNDNRLAQRRPENAPTSSGFHLIHKMNGTKAALDFPSLYKVRLDATKSVPRRDRTDTARLLVGRRLSARPPHILADTWALDSADVCPCH